MWYMSSPFVGGVGRDNMIYLNLDRDNYTTATVCQLQFGETRT